VRRDPRSPAPDTTPDETADRKSLRSERAEGSDDAETAWAAVQGMDVRADKAQGVVDGGRSLSLWEG
jgi:hypothetical protein